MREVHGVSMEYPKTERSKAIKGCTEAAKFENGHV